MNKLSIEKQSLVLAHLVEGNSIRSIERMTGIHQNTIMRLLVRVGNEAEIALSRAITEVPCKLLELDEIWTYVGAKQRHLIYDDRFGERGDQFVFIAIDAETKLIPHFTVGKRDEETTSRFIWGLKDRIQSDGVQFSTDAYGPYLRSIASVFPSASHGQVIKHYGPEYLSERRYSPPKVRNVTKRARLGNPDMDLVSTSYVERQNLTLRMSCRRFARLTNAFSKKLENLIAACSLYVYWYNFIRVHQTVRMTPAMAAGLTDHVWGWEPILG